MKNTKKRGFTIVELVIVIAVIAILAAVLIPTFGNVIESAKKSNAMQAARNAWTDWLAKDASKISDRQKTSLCIQSGDYFFDVKDGKFDATADGAACTQTGEEGSKTPVFYKVVDGTLEEGHVNNP